jgi:hypothetical protein
VSVVSADPIPVNINGVQPYPKARAARAAAAKAFTWQRNAKLTKKIYDEIGFYLASQHRRKAPDPLSDGVEFVDGAPLQPPMR